MRTGIIRTPMGGAHSNPCSPPSLLGAGEPLGGGRQYQSWISLDHVYATYHLMTGIVRRSLQPHGARAGRTEALCEKRLERSCSDLGLLLHPVLSSGSCLENWLKRSFWTANVLPSA